jgi:Rieske Fe-S protein
VSEVETSRRNLIYGVAAVGVAVPILAACGSSGSSDDASVEGVTASDDSIKTSDVPVGGGAIFPDAKIVVTQPTAGEFKAFSSTCTHAGCAVNKVADGTIDCPCHGSKYSITDGSVQTGPAPRALAEKTVTLDPSGATLKVS